MSPAAVCRLQSRAVVTAAPWPSAPPQQPSRSRSIPRAYPELRARGFPCATRAKSVYALVQISQAKFKKSWLAGPKSESEIVEALVRAQGSAQQVCRCCATVTVP